VKHNDIPLRSDYSKIKRQEDANKKRHWRDAKMKGRFVQRERGKGLTEAPELAKPLRMCC
jgi:hypothetical protein